MERKTGRLIASGMEAQTGNWEGKNEKQRTTNKIDKKRPKRGIE